MNIRLFFFTLSFTILQSYSQSVELEELTNSFFESNTQEGRVKYKELYKDPIELKRLVQLYGMMNVDEWTEVEQKAFYINAYNLFVIDQLIEHYPVNSPQEIPAFFTSKNFLLASKGVSLNYLEKELLDPNEDPRLHFALICGAKGCPPIASFAYSSNKLDSLLDSQTTRALNDESFLFFSLNREEVFLSEIFKWYENDFKSQSKSLIAYINGFRTNAIELGSKIRFYPYDWTINSVESIQLGEGGKEEEKSNLELFTPSALFQWGEYEINWFNSLYFQNSIRNSSGEELKLETSQAFFNSLLQFTSGLPKSRRLNIGVDINITTARYGPSEESPLDFFRDETAIYKKTILSSIGPRIKYVPFKSIPRLSVQSTFLIPVAKDQETPFFIFHDRYTWFTQLFFDQNIGSKFQLFTEADLLYRFDRDSEVEGNFFRVPLSAFLSYFPNSNTTIYAFSQYSPRYENVMLSDRTEFGLSSWFTQLGLGAKYQISKALGMEVSYADFILSNNDGAGYTVNFGLRYIHR